MNCEEFNDRLDDLLDQRRPLELEGALSAHAGDCPFCARQAASYEALLTGVAELPQASVSPGFSRRVIAELAATADSAAPEPVHLVALDARPTPMPRSRRWLSWGAPVAAAAVALVVVALLVRGLSRDDPAPTAPQVVQQHDAPAAPAVERAQPAVAPGEGLPPGRALALARVTGRMAEELAAGQTVWARHGLDRIKPITESIPAAIEALRKSMPEPDERSHDS